MKSSRIVWTLLVLLCASYAFAQTQAFAPPDQQLLPPSSEYSVSAPQTVTLPAQDNRTFLLEDEANYALAQQQGVTPPALIARPQEVNYNLNNSGSWEMLPDGSRIWRLRIVSPNATDTWLVYDQWRIVKPCELFLYNDDRSMIYGPYTSVDNWDGTNVTPIIRGEAVTLEYHVPVDQSDVGELSVLRVLHGYRHFHDVEARDRDALDAFGDAEACHVNINCFGYMQEEKRAVALVADPMGGVCSGTMLNNTLQNGDPLFLTADHCLNGNQNNWLFYFNYESPACSPNTNGSLNHVVSNATLLSNWLDSDFALLRLSRPRPNSPFIPAFMGWDRWTGTPSSTYGIHHPIGDVKKGCEDYNPPTTSGWNGNFPNTHWAVQWDNGVTQGGSSGSPLIANTGRVIGQLHGGLSSCSTPNAADRYGKLSVSWDGGGNQSTRLRDWLDPNNSGSQVSNYWQPFGPPNDSCGQPGFTNITTLPFSASGSTLFAANNFNTIACNYTNTAPEVIYTLNLPCDHTVTVSTCGSNFDTELFVFQGSCSQWFTQAGCNDDFCGTQSQVTFNAQGGVSYTIVLEGYASSWGNFVLNVTGTAAGAQGNAQCPGYEITEVPYFTYGATDCGGDDVNPTCQSNDAQDVHWYWVSPYNQVMRAKTCYINFDTILQVREGGACPGTWATGCSDDYFCGSSSLASTVVFDASVGQVYYVTMDGYDGATGFSSLELEVWNDACATPYVIPSLPFNDFGDTRPARDDIATYFNPAAKDVLFQYMSPICQNMGVSMCFETGYDSYVEVRTGGPCPGTTVVAFNDDYCGLASQATWAAEANRTYYIVVSGFQDSAGPFSIQFYNIPGAIPAPAGDVCETALQIPTLPFTDYGNTCCMADNYTPCVGPDSREVVYNYYSTTCQDVTVSLCGSSYDTGLGIYGGTCPNIAPLIVCSDDDDCGGAFSFQSTATFRAEPNTNYQILVHGFSSNCGDYVINASGVPCPPPVALAPDSLVIRVEPSTSSAQLFWSSALNANVYHIYRSTDQNDIVSPANLIADVATNSFDCSGCLNEPLFEVFFAVTAEYVPVAATAPNESGNNAALGLTKADAVMSVVRENPALLMNNEVEEQAYKNGK